MKININDVFQFPNGEYQYKVINEYIGEYQYKFSNEYITFHGVYIELKKCLNGVFGCQLTLEKNNPLFKEQNRIYNDKTGIWRKG